MTGAADSTSLSGGQVAAPSAKAAALAAEIVALRAFTVRVAEFLRGRYMELLWELRREWPEGPIGDDSFERFAGGLGLDPDEASRQVGVWDHARAHRSVRELANKSPEQAMTFVSRLMHMDGEGDLPSPDDDPEVAKIMTMPPRKMSREIRKLIDTAREPATADSDGGSDDTADNNLVSLSAARPARLLRDAAEVEDKLSLLARRLDGASALGGASQDRLLRLADLMAGHIDRIVETVDRHPTEGHGNDD